MELFANGVKNYGPVPSFADIKSAVKRDIIDKLLTPANKQAMFLEGYKASNDYEFNNSVMVIFYHLVNKGNGNAGSYKLMRVLRNDKFFSYYQLLTMYASLYRRVQQIKAGML